MRGFRRLVGARDGGGGSRPALLVATAALSLWVALAGGPASVARAAEVHWSSALSTALEQARAEQKYVMVDFFTSWCSWCKVLDQKTYNDSRVTDLTDRMVSVKVNAEVDKAAAATYAVRAYPTIAFLNPDGTLRRRVTGFQPPEAFVPILQDVLKTDSELFALSRRLLTAPRDASLRLDYARALTRSADFRGAAVQLDTLLSIKEIPEPTRAEAELDRWISLLRAGGEPGPDKIRGGLGKWVKKRGKHHDRRAEGLYFLALSEEQAGKMKDARKHYVEIVEFRPGSWFAEEARARLAVLKT